MAPACRSVIPPGFLIAPALPSARAHGQMRDLVEGPAGFLYVATGNCVGRGKPAPDDDRVIGLVPRR